MLRKSYSKNYTLYFVFLTYNPTVLRIRIRDPVPFWTLDPGWVKKQDPDPV